MKESRTLIIEVQNTENRCLHFQLFGANDNYTAPNYGNYQNELYGVTVAKVILDEKEIPYFHLLAESMVKPFMVKRVEANKKMTLRVCVGRILQNKEDSKEIILQPTKSTPEFIIGFGVRMLGYIDSKSKLTLTFEIK